MKIIIEDGPDGQDAKELTALFDIALKSAGVQIMPLINKLNAAITVAPVPAAPAAPKLSAEDDKEVEDTNEE